MAELQAKSPLAHVPKRKIGSVTLAEVDLGSLTSVAPFNGEVGAVSKALKADYGVAFPAPGRSNQSAAAQVIWFGQGMALLVGPDPTDKLAIHAATTDQSDAWVSVRLSGDAVQDVLARLTPTDLRMMHFPEGHTARTLLGHMAASITRVGPDAFLILVYRSMADTLLEELETAMENVAARS